MLFGSILAVVLIILATLASVNAVNLRSIHIGIDKEFVYAKEDRVGPYPEPDPEPGFSYQTSECIYNDECGNGECEDIEFIVDGNDLTYYHYSEMIYNCCATMIIQLEMEESTIRFIELEHFGEEGPCYCICDYELTATVYSLPSGEYTVEVWGYFDDGSYTELHCQTTITI